MALSNKLVSKFVKATKADTNTKKEKTVYGNIVFRYNNTYYAVIDGATYDKEKIQDAILNGKTPDTTGLIPISRFTENVDIADSKKVIIKIKDHNAIVTGTIDVNDDPVTVGKQVEEALTEFEPTSSIAIADIQALWTSNQ